jgi:integrase
VRGNRKRREVKSSRSRSFPIHPNLLKVLQSLPRVDGYVFHGRRGGRLKPDTVRRVLVREVIQPLSAKFPTPEGEKGFQDGRLHSFRHAFCNTCANAGVPERVLMDWLGHNDAGMIRIYYHLHDKESRKQMNALDFLGGAGGRSAGDANQGSLEGGGAVPST